MPAKTMNAAGRSDYVAGPAKTFRPRRSQSDVKVQRARGERTQSGLGTSPLIMEARSPLIPQSKRKVVAGPRAYITTGHLSGSSPSVSHQKRSPCSFSPQVKRPPGSRFTKAR